MLFINIQMTVFSSIRIFPLAYKIFKCQMYILQTFGYILVNFMLLISNLFSQRSKNIQSMVLILKTCILDQNSAYFGKCAMCSCKRMCIPGLLPKYDFTFYVCQLKLVTHAKISKILLIFFLSVFLVT